MYCQLWISLMEMRDLLEATFFRIHNELIKVFYSSLAAQQRTLASAFCAYSLHLVLDLKIYWAQSKYCPKLSCYQFLQVSSQRDFLCHEATIFSYISGHFNAKKENWEMLPILFTMKVWITKLCIWLPEGSRLLLMFEENIIKFFLPRTPGKIKNILLS